jgi:uncharacterized membrane protein
MKKWMTWRLSENIILIFLTFGLIFGIFFVVFTPVFWGVDEHVHFYRAYQMSKGKLFPDKTKLTTNGKSGYIYTAELPTQMISLGEERSQDLLNNPSSTNIVNRNDYNPSPYTQDIYGNIDISKTSVGDVSGSATYFPVGYLMYAAPLALLPTSSSPHTQVISARMLGLIVYLALCTVAISMLRESRYRHLIALVALLPISLFQASTVTMDGLCIGLCLIIFAGVVRALSNDSPELGRVKKLIFLFALIVLPLLKASFIIVTISSLLFPIDLLLGKLPSLKVAKYRINARLLIAILLVLISAVWYKHATSITVSGNITQRPGVEISLIKQIINSLEHPNVPIKALLATIFLGADSYYIGLTGLLGASYVSSPLVSSALVLALLAVMSQYLPVIMGKKQKLYSIAVAGSSVLIIFGLLYATYNAVGSRKIEGIQPRYFIPLIPFLILPLSNLRKLKIFRQDFITDKIYTRLQYMVLLLVLLYTSVYYYLAIY